jgi:anti-anti-sigma regulatory factor
MLDLEMTTRDGCAVLRVVGPIRSAADADTISAAMSFVPIDDHVIVDLRDVDRLSPRCADALHAALVERMHCAETVIVSTCPEVTLQLVLRAVDAVAPVLANIDDALAIVRIRSGHDASLMGEVA